MEDRLSSLQLQLDRKNQENIELKRRLETLEKKQVESSAIELPITNILSESIDSIQENIKTVIVSIESKLIPRTKRKIKRKANVDLVNEFQLDMFALRQLIAGGFYSLLLVRRRSAFTNPFSLSLQQISKTKSGHWLPVYPVYKG